MMSLFQLRNLKMGYIRDDEDYYRSLGYSDERIAIELATSHIDYGYCNPIKAKLADEEEKEIVKKLKEEGKI